MYISFHSCQILSPSKTGSIVSAHRLTNITLLTLIATLQLQGESPTYILNEDTQPVIRAIGVSHTACKDEFRQNLRSHSWSVFSFSLYICWMTFVVDRKLPLCGLKSRRFRKLKREMHVLPNDHRKRESIGHCADTPGE